jgi:hypothetical protein
METKVRGGCSRKEKEWGGPFGSCVTMQTRVRISGCGTRARPRPTPRPRGGNHHKWGVAPGNRALGISIQAVQPGIQPFYGHGLPRGWLVVVCGRGCGCRLLCSHRIPGLTRGPQTFSKAYLVQPGSTCSGTRSYMVPDGSK